MDGFLSTSVLHLRVFVTQTASPVLRRSVARRLGAMRQLGLVLSLWVCAPVFAAPPTEPIPHPHVRLEATLDPSAHRVDGEVWFSFINSANRPVSELYLHL